MQESVSGWGETELGSILISSAIRVGGKEMELGPAVN